MTRRSRVEILVSILDELDKGPLKKTQILYHCNISWATLNDAVDSLTSRSLIEMEKTEKTGKYEITEKGKEALAFHKNLRDRML